MSKKTKFIPPSEEEFRNALEYGKIKNKISDTSKADPQKSFVGAGSVTIRDKDENYLFSVNIMILRNFQHEKKRIQSEKVVKSVKIGGCLLTPLILFVGCSTLLSISDQYANERKSKRESFLASLDYSNPVKVYRYTNEIWDERSSNKLIFNKNRQGKMVHVIGRIPKKCIQDDYVCIEGAQFDILPPRIDCYVRDKEILTKLRSGMTIKVAGLMDFEQGAILDDVRIKYCKVSTNVSQRGANLGEAYSDTYDQFNQLFSD